MSRNEIKPNDQRPCSTFNQAPTGHKIPDGRSADDPSMDFSVPDCGVKAGGQFITPFILDDEDLPGTVVCNRQGH
jgi:hypothetical protein